MPFRQYGNNVGSTELDDVDDKNEDQDYDGMYAGNDGNNVEERQNGQKWA